MLKKTPVIHILLIALASFVSALSAAERDSAKVLTIGNSFADNATKYLPDLAKAGGKTFILGKANIGGCTLERHAKHLGQAQAGETEGSAYKNFTHPETGNKEPSTLIEALKATDWDFVTIQQHSWASTQPETYQPHADQLIAAIRQYAPQAEILVQETWAYNPEHDLLAKNDMTQEQMYDILATNYRGFADGLGLSILPSGDAFQVARQTPQWTYTPDTEYDFQNPTPPKLPKEAGALTSIWHWRKNKDGTRTLGKDAKHANKAGCYLLGCVWYLVLYNADSVPDYNPSGVTKEEAASLREAAVKAVQAERARAKAQD